MTRSLALLALLAFASPATADPSAHTDAGLLCEIDFREGSARLPDASVSQLQQVAIWANENWNGLVVLDGHADSRGEHRDNIKLSMRRAKLVRHQLIALGVDPSQIVVSAFGPENRPQARVAIWGTKGSLESVIAARKAEQAKQKQKSNAARRSRSRSR